MLDMLSYHEPASDVYCHIMKHSLNPSSHLTPSLIMSSLPPLSCPHSLPYHVLTPSLITPHSLPYHVLTPSLIMSSLPPLSCPRSLPYHVLTPSLIMSSLPPLSCPRSLPYHVLAPSLIMSLLPPLSCHSLPYHVLTPSLIMSSLPPLSCPCSLPYHVLAPSLIMSLLPPLSCPHSLPYHVLAPSLIMYNLAKPDPRTRTKVWYQAHTQLCPRGILAFVDTFVHAASTWASSLVLRFDWRCTHGCSGTKLYRPSPCVRVWLIPSLSPSSPPQLLTGCPHVWCHTGAALPGHGGSGVPQGVPTGTTVLSPPLAHPVSPTPLHPPTSLSSPFAQHKHIL